MVIENDANPLIARAASLGASIGPLRTSAAGVLGLTPMPAREAASTLTSWSTAGVQALTKPLTYGLLSET